MTIDVPSLVLIAGGELVGKVRLQKVVYLLDQMGLQSGFSYVYRHYGPFSEDLSEQVEDDVIFGRLRSEQRHRQSDGVPYVSYGADGAGDGEPVDTHLPLIRVQVALAEMQRRSATVLELAATIHWLAIAEGRTDWQDELLRRKGVKAQNGRDRQAFDLLGTLRLPPAVEPAALA